MREVSKMADSICPVLKTTFDCPGLQECGKMPLLSLKVWVARIEKEGGRQEWETLWEYYRNVKIKTYFQRSCREDGSRVFRVAEGGHKDALFYGDKYGLRGGGSLSPSAPA